MNYLVHTILSSRTKRRLLNEQTSQGYIAVNNPLVSKKNIQTKLDVHTKIYVLSFDKG